MRVQPSGSGLYGVYIYGFGYVLILFLAAASTCQGRKAWPHQVYADE